MFQTSTALENMRILFMVSRPLWWPVAPCLYFSGILHAGDFPSTKPALLFALALSFPLCLVTFGVNDAYDYDSDIQNPRKTKYLSEGAVLSRENHGFVLLVSKATTAFILLCSMPASVQRPRLLLCTLSFLFLTWAYSSPPIRLKERPILDSMSNGAILWLFWASGYCSGSSKALQRQTDHTNGAFVFFYACACHGLASIVDTQPDSSAGHRTISTSLGVRFAALFSAIFFLLANYQAQTWSNIGMASLAGVVSSLCVCLLPSKGNRIGRLALTGTYCGTIIWIFQRILEIREGKEMQFPRF